MWISTTATAKRGFLCGAVVQHFVNIRDKKFSAGFERTLKLFYANIQFVKRISESKRKNCYLAKL